MNIIELAKQAGMVYREFEDEFANCNTDGVDLKTMQAFTALVAAHEREACAKLFETITKDPAVPPVHFSLSDTAKLIRARGTT